MAYRLVGKISTLPLATLDAMWNKAEEYLLSSSDIQTAPGNDRKSKMVTSRSGGTPHFVRVVSPGHYVCDKSCLQWSSSQICSHTLAAAEVNGELSSFIQWYTVTGQEPNITRLAQAVSQQDEDEKVGFPSESVAGHPLFHQILLFHDQQLIIPSPEASFRPQTPPSQEFGTAPLPGVIYRQLVTSSPQVRPTISPQAPLITLSMLAIGPQLPSSLQVASSLQDLQVYHPLCKHLTLN